MIGDRWSCSIIPIGWNVFDKWLETDNEEVISHLFIYDQNAMESLTQLISCLFGFELEIIV